MKELQKVSILLLALTMLLQITACAVQATPAFADVSPDADYAQAVTWCAEKGLMNGVEDGTNFDPRGSMTRAMLATILYRQAGEPKVNDNPDFTDAQPNVWYSNAVTWAAEKRLLRGYGNGLFGVSDPVSKEMLNVVIARQNGENPAWTGSAELAVPATRAEAAVALYETFYGSEPEPTRRPSGGGPSSDGGSIRPTPIPTPAPTPTPTPTPAPESGKVLVAYFSATGTTRPVAEKVAQATNGDLFEIVPAQPYTTEDLNYNTDCRANAEQNDPNARPAIQNKVENMGQYDAVLIGYPIWHGRAPKIIHTFLETYDLSGKTIATFCTSGGSGHEDATLRGYEPDATWLEGRRFSGTSQVESWVNGLELTEKEEEALPYDGVYPQHEPYGTAVGAMPGRVVWAYDPASVSWDGSGYWWELDHFDESAIQTMVDRSIASLAGKDTAKESWAALFAANRRSRGLTGGYTKGQKIAIKANINGSGVMDDDTSGHTAMSYTNPVLLKALLTSLVKDAEVAPGDITVYDVSRLFPEYMVELCTQGQLDGVHFVGRNNGVADENAPIQWSHSFSGKVNYLPTCVTQAEYVINLANLKGHSYGITLCGKNHFGSFINGNLMRPPEGANLHQWLTRNEMGIYSPLVDLMANADLGGKTVLYMLDAIICAPSEGASITADNSKWQQAPFNGHYTASVFVSQDPVAIDSVGADFLMNEPAVTNRNGSLRNNATVENYLHEAALVSHAPSKTAYTDSQGHTVINLGVHEHWNNSTQKQYSRNLGKTEGIELIQLLEE